MITISNELYKMQKRQTQQNARYCRACIIFIKDYSICGQKNRQELPPLGTLYFAAALNEVGVDVHIIPISSESDYIKIPVADFYLYSITSSIVYQYFFSINNYLKRLSPDSIFLAGNIHASLFPKRVIKELGLDGVTAGESEYSALVMLENYFTKDRTRLFENVPSSYNSNGDTIIKDRVFLEDISEIPPPLRTALSDEEILLHGRIKVNGYENAVATTIITSRGCPYRCHFCANPNNGTIRYRNAESIRRELSTITNDYPTLDSLILMDETATINKYHLNTWAQIISEFRLPYIITTRGDELDKDKISILASTGCKEIKMGLETASIKLLNKMNKKLDLSLLCNSLVLNHDHGINNKLFLMHGFPGENLSTTYETIDFLERNKQYINRVVLYQFIPLPGSYVYNHPKEFDLVTSINENNLTIYNNNTHWWGSQNNFEEMISSYKILNSYINDNFKR